MIKAQSFVQRIKSERDGYWESHCKRHGFKVDDVFVVSKVVDGTIFFQGDAIVMGAWSKEYFKEVDSLQGKESNALDNNMVTKPKHYEFFEGVEAITIIARSMTEKQFAGYCMGNALKYRLRAGKKFNTEEDLKKADYYKELFQKHRHECIDEDI